MNVFIKWDSIKNDKFGWRKLTICCNSSRQSLLRKRTLQNFRTKQATLVSKKKISSTPLKDNIDLHTKLNIGSDSVNQNLKQNKALGFANYTGYCIAWFSFENYFEVYKSIKMLIMKSIFFKTTEDGFYISQSGLHLRLLPKSSSSTKGKRHVTAVPVKLIRAHDYHMKHIDGQFCTATVWHLPCLEQIRFVFSHGNRHPAMDLTLKSCCLTRVGYINQKWYNKLVKPILVFNVDGRPDENPRYQKIIKVAIHHF